MYSGKLSVALAACSATIWNQRACADRVNLKRLETSDTELIVQRLTEALWNTNLQASLRVFAARDESDKGADLEIWLGLKQGFSIGFTIQAKRTTFTPTRLLQAKTIMQKSGTRGRSTTQYEDLISHGKNVEANPVHLLYSGWNDPEPGDPLVRGRGMPSQYGASVLPTWWFSAALGWGNRPGVGKQRVDLLNDVIIPFEWLLEPENVRNPSARVRKLYPWFENEYVHALESQRTVTMLSRHLPFDRRPFSDVKSAMQQKLGLPDPDDELVDYALLGISMGSAEYGPSATTKVPPHKPYDFGLSRNIPAYARMPFRHSQTRNDPTSTSPDNLSPAPDDTPIGQGKHRAQRELSERVSASSREDAGSRRHRIQVEFVEDSEEIVQWQRESGVESLPRVVLAIT